MQPLAVYQTESELVHRLPPARSLLHRRKKESICHGFPPLSSSSSP